jgi:hypothetical protein
LLPPVKMAETRSEAGKTRVNGPGQKVFISGA